jgi:hypothetical protein
MDYMSSLPSTKHDNDCVFVVVDRFSKMSIMMAYKKNIIAEATAKLFFERVWVNFGIPQCWLWSLIIFLIQRSLLCAAMFIPHEVFTPQKYVHSSMQGSAEGGTLMLCGVHPPRLGGLGASEPPTGVQGVASPKAPEEKIAL